MAIEIAVIVPTYNRADLIGETLDSILGQSYPPAEVIVVDDGSTDHTEAVVRRYGSAVRYTRITNSGDCGARNAGVSIARAPWMAFCDSDDLWREDKLSKQVQLIESSPNLQFIFTNFQTVTDGHWSKATKFDTAPQGYWDLPKRQVAPDLVVVETSMYDRLLVHQPVFPSTVMMTKAYSESIGPWPEPLGRTRSADLEFLLRCVNHPEIGVVFAPVVGIRKHAANFSGDSLKTTLGEIAIRRYVLEHHPVAKQFAPQIADQIATRSAIAAESAFASGDLDKMRQFLADVPFRSRSWKLHFKTLIARCPNTLGRFLQRNAVGIGASPPRVKPRLVR